MSELTVIAAIWGALLLLALTTIILLGERPDLRWRQRRIRKHNQRRKGTIGGSMKAGPSQDYQELLRGEIEPAEYVRRLKQDVTERMSR